jgi:hypothetical protein
VAAKVPPKTIIRAFKLEASPNSCTSKLKAAKKIETNKIKEMNAWTTMGGLLLPVSF